MQLICAFRLTEIDDPDADQSVQESCQVSRYGRPIGKQDVRDDWVLDVFLLDPEEGKEEKETTDERNEGRCALPGKCVTAKGKTENDGGGSDEEYSVTDPIDTLELLR
jgi:hypothetical protein